MYKKIFYNSNKKCWTIFFSFFKNYLASMINILIYIALSRIKCLFWYSVFEIRHELLANSVFCLKYYFNSKKKNTYIKYILQQYKSSQSRLKFFWVHVLHILTQSTKSTSVIFQPGAHNIGIVISFSTIYCLQR